VSGSGGADTSGVAGKVGWAVGSKLGVGSDLAAVGTGVAGLADGALVGSGVAVGAIVDAGEAHALANSTRKATARLLICQPPPMQYQRFGDRYQLRFASGERLVDTILAFLAAKKVGFATMTAIGALSSATISYWNAATQQYESHQIDEQVEFVSLIGNVSLKDGAPFVHAHVTLGRSDLTTLGGHLNEAAVHPNVELWLWPESESVDRAIDDGSGLHLMSLRERL
jgi:predicted DNA-binding protein with PD1-like motif